MISAVHTTRLIGLLVITLQAFILAQGCSDDVVDVDGLTPGSSLVGMWTLDCDSASDGSMELRIGERNIEATVWLGDSVYNSDGPYTPPPTNKAREGWGYLFLGNYFTGCQGDCNEFWFYVEVHPSKELMRGWFMVRHHLSWTVAYSDSVTVIRQ